MSYEYLWSCKSVDSYISECMCCGVVVSWTIIEIVGEDKTFKTLFNEIKAGKFDCINVTGSA